MMIRDSLPKSPMTVRRSVLYQRPFAGSKGKCPLFQPPKNRWLEVPIPCLFCFLVVLQRFLLFKKVGLPRGNIQIQKDAGFNLQVEKVKEPKTRHFKKKDPLVDPMMHIKASFQTFSLGRLSKSFPPRSTLEPP